MKFSAALALVVFVGLVANSSAWPVKKRMVYLAEQQPQWYGGPQRMMYVQYVQPSHTHARSTQAAEALVAGESVATGTYLNDCDHAEADIAVAGLSEQHQHSEDALGAAGAHDVQAVAEAHPEENEVEVDAQVAGGASVNVATDVALDAVADIAGDADVAGDAAAAEGAAVDGAAALDAAVAVEAAVAAEEAVSVDSAVSVEGGASVDGASAVEVEVENHEAKEPRDYNFEAVEAEAGAAEVEVAAEEPAAVPAVSVDVAAELPAPAPIAPVAPAVPVTKPARRYLPSNKKVYVELEQSAESDDAVVQDDDEDDEEVAATPVKPVRGHNARRPNKKAAQSAGAAKPTKAPLPAGSFFPIDFGGTSGGAIAIANSFSTGEGGSATSHAIAYGSPDAARSRSRPSKLH